MNLPTTPATLEKRVMVELETRRSKAYRDAVKERCREDPAWFLDFFGFTFDPRVIDGSADIPFFLYPFQRDLITWLQHRLKDPETKLPSDGIIEKSRDMGVTWVTLGFILHQWIFGEGFTCLLGSRKEEEVDNFTETSLFGKIDYLINHLPGWMLPQGFTRRKHRFERRLVNPSNGNLILGESSNPQFSRGRRLRMVFFDEGAFWPDFEAAWTSAYQSTKTRIVVSTPNGMNAFGRLANDEKRRIPKLTIHWSLHPHKDAQWYEAEKARMPNDVAVAQELDISYSRSVSGVVYPMWQEVPAGDYPYNEKWPLYVTVDPGIADPTAIIWAQRNPKDGRIRLLESYTNKGKPADFYIPLITGELPGDWPYRYDEEELEIILRHSTWGTPMVYIDPAARQRSQSTGLSIISLYRHHGVVAVSKPEAQDHKTRITQTQLLMRVMERDEIGTAELHESMLSYRFPERDQDSSATTEIVKPVHNAFSHLPAALEYLCVNLPPLRRGTGTRPAPIRVKMAYDTR